jgi:hypothetical protein
MLPFGQHDGQIVLGVPVEIVAAVVVRQQVPTQTLGLHL